MPPSVKPVQAPIPFIPDQSSGLDVLRGASPSAINVIIDGNGTVSRRPGIELTVLGAEAISENPIVGLHATSASPIRVYAFAGNLPGALEVYRLSAGGAHRLDEALFPVTADTRPSITETEAMIPFATSHDVYKILLDTDKVSTLGGNPPDGSHVITNSSRLLLNDTGTDKTRIFYSAQALGTSITGHETWNSGLNSGSFVAEGRTDPVVAIAENSNEVWVFGTTSLQTFQTDANLVYVSQATIEYGCATPFGIIKSDQIFAWMDDKRRFIRSDGREGQVFSQPIQQTLDELERVDDCFGYRVVTGPIDAFVWAFPADGRSFVYQQGGGWSTWMSYSDVTSNWAPFIVTAHTFLFGANDNIVGTSTGSIGVMRNGVNTDLGVRIPAYIDTGFLDRGTDSRKHCISVRIALRRGNTPAVITPADIPDYPGQACQPPGTTPSDVSTTEEPFGTLQWRDEEGAWKSPIRISFGRSGQREIVRDIRSLGVYRRRQWRFSFHGTSDFVLAGVTEEYLTLGN